MSAEVTVDVFPSSLGIDVSGSATSGANALKAEGYATGTQNGVPVGSGSEYYQNNAKYFAETGSYNEETVTGATPVIVGVKNKKYLCGTLTSLSITPPVSGMMDVRFTSGSTPTVLTVPNTVIFPGWFDATALEANTVYEINIEDGVYATVMTW